MPTWIDFKELRAKLDFEAVLKHYGVELKRKGDQHLGFCPLPGHQGKRNSPSFSANIPKKIFHCFGCQAEGNVLDFAVLMAGASPEDGRALKKVAAELRARFCPETERQASRGQKLTAPSEPSDEQLELNVVINAPLDFELQGLDPRHPYLASRGLSPETIAHFGLGYCARGSLSGRIAIPLHDDQGSLIGYAGRIVDDKAINEENPKYRFPGRRERNGEIFDFRKTRFLYNGNRVTPGLDLMVVEGFPSVWWLHQNGYPYVVATMGAECSSEQLELIVAAVDPQGTVWIMPDADPAGEKLAERLLLGISMYRRVRWCKLPWEKQPTDLTAEELKQLMC